MVKARKLDEAIQAFQKAVRSAPDRIELRLDLAHALMDLKREHEAIEQLKLGLSLQPENTSALNDLGLALTAMKRFSEAVVYLRHATRVDPSHFNAWNNLGVAFTRLGRLKAAEAAFECALKLSPGSNEAWMNLANHCAHDGRLPEALACFDIVSFNRPRDVAARWARAIALLSHGEFEKGFEEYECRLQMLKSRVSYSQPMWDGSDLTGKTILLWQEQDLGDTIQFIRYATLVKGRGAAKVIVECQAPLTRFFQTCAGIDMVIVADAPARQRPPFDFQVSLMSLPRIFGTTLNTVPADAPYLSAEPDRVEQWRLKLWHAARTSDWHRVAGQSEAQMGQSPFRATPPFFPFGGLEGCSTVQPPARRRL